MARDPGDNRDVEKGAVLQVDCEGLLASPKYQPSGFIIPTLKYTPLSVSLSVAPHIPPALHNYMMEEKNGGRGEVGVTWQKP